ncbi:zonular occludens toxin family protein [Marinimicrobium agarilyticum]|uniref:zonular occludens toxin family protein n=1 Tax=Marinimicrobium agarilyticum TaxID=306546 RepID=UPI00040EF55A|nr:zonular occludens toxin domain-containing protein [Marinimicrobium agarilyticum]
MTAVIHHGPPGSFKSFSIVQRVMIPALIEGRELVTNIRGFNDIDRIAEVMKVDIPDTAKIHQVHADSEEGFDHIAKFFHWAPAGALIVIDEGQRAYPTRLRSFSQFDQADDIPLTYSDGTVLTDAETGEPMNRPATVENAFDQHRHCNWDIYICTPNIAKVHKEIRGVVEWAFRHRDMTGLLPWNKKPRWREFKHDAEANGKSVSHYFGTPKTYKVNPQVFECYQSTKTGKAKSSNENISVLRDRKLQLAIVLVIGALVWMATQVSTVLAKFTEDPRESLTQNLEMDRAGPDTPHSNDSVHGAGKPRGQRSYPAHAPLSGYRLYWVGSINDRLLFHAYETETQYITLTDEDLKAMGYELDPRQHAFVRIHYGQTQQVVHEQPRPKPAPPEDEVSRIDGGAGFGAETSL